MVNATKQYFCTIGHLLGAISQQSFCENWRSRKVVGFIATQDNRNGLGLRNGRGTFSIHKSNPQQLSKLYVSSGQTSLSSLQRGVYAEK
jgi:hypothetical protein